MLKSLYGTYATGELMDFIEKGKFSSYIVRSLGRELNGNLESLEEDGENHFGIMPVVDLYEILSGGWNLEVEWFEWTDGIYRDDDGIEIPPSVDRSFTPAEQMAAYGLYLLKESIGCCGDLPEQGYNDQGWTRDGILEHEAACLIMANQAITYAHVLKNAETKEPTERINSAMSILGRLGADAAHAENRAMKKLVFDWCDANLLGFKSMDSAAEAVAGKIVPVTFRTARAWIASWKKNRRSAGTL